MEMVWYGKYGPGQQHCDSRELVDTCPTHVCRAGGADSARESWCLTTGSSVQDLEEKHSPAPLRGAQKF